MPQGGEQGRWGDYVFNQEGIQSLSGTKYTPLNDFGVCAALDQIITQIMENSAAHPVPATDEIMEKLPREVLEEGCKLISVLPFLPSFDTMHATLSQHRCWIKTVPCAKSSSN